MGSDDVVKAQPVAGLLRSVARLLPAGQAEWGEAMQAELVSISGLRPRVGFVLGCVRAILGRRKVGPAASLLFRFAAAAGALLLLLAAAGAIEVASTRFEAMGAGAVLIGVHALLRSRMGCGPVSEHRAVKAVAVGGTGMALVLTLLTFRRLHVDPPLTLLPNATLGIPDTKRATDELVALTIMLALGLITLASVTARRSTLARTVVTTGGGVAAVVVTLWSAAVLLDPGISSSGPAAVAALIGAGVAGGALINRLDPGPHQTARADQVLITGLIAGSGAAFGIGMVMDLLPLTGAWVANNAPPAFGTPAPTRIVDTVVVYLPGLLLILALNLKLALQTRRTRHIRRSEGVA